MNDEAYNRGHIASEERYKMALERQRKSYRINSTQKSVRSETNNGRNFSGKRYVKKKARYRQSKKRYALELTLAVVCVILCITIINSICRNADADIDVANNVEYITISNTASTQSTAQQVDTSSEEQSGIVNNQAVQNNDIIEYNKNCDWTMYLVNSDYPIEGEYEINTKLLQGYEVDTRIYASLTEMMNSALKDGIQLKISSAYRTYDYQQSLFDREVNTYLEQGFSYPESYNLAKRSVAVPNSSEHQIGLAVDLNDVSEDFKYTSAYSWLCENAVDYGFIERYPDGKSDITKIIYEPWHYRYVGKENAKAIKSSGLCLEEYITQVEIPQMKSQEDSLYAG